VAAAHAACRSPDLKARLTSDATEFSDFRAAWGNGGGLSGGGAGDLRSRMSGVSGPGVSFTGAPLGGSGAGVSGWAGGGAGVSGWGGGGQRDLAH
jgi:hypothetical protein